MASNTVRVEHFGPITVVTMNRPKKLNAWNQELIRTLGTTLESVSGPDKDSRVVIVTGAGRAFSAGGDMEMFAAPAHTHAQKTLTRGMAEAFNAGLNAPQVFIAAIRGPCVGAALVMAGCCDFRLATPDARFLFPEVKIGMVPAIGVARIAHAMPDRMMRYLMITGDAYDAARAEHDGFVDWIVEPDALMDEAFALAERICKNPAETVRLCKRVARFSRGPDPQLAMDYEWEVNQALRKYGPTEALAKDFIKARTGTGKRRGKTK